jgi:hypothetical protein
MLPKFVLSLTLVPFLSGCFTTIQLADPNERLPAIPKEYDFNDTQSVFIFGRYIGGSSGKLMVRKEDPDSSNFGIKLDKSGMFIERIPKGQYSLYISKRNISEGNCAACMKIAFVSDYSVFEKKLDLSDVGIFDLGAINLQKGEVYKHFIQDYSKGESKQWVLKSYSKMDSTKIKTFQFQPDERQ